jgi:hypothetical protein
MVASPILILGMHRSGTSCLAGSLQHRGLHLGEVYEARPYNRKGNRENQRIMDLNADVLAASDGSWDRPPRTLRWDDACAARRDAIVAALAAGSGDRPWGFKDPRSLLTLPFWLEAIPEARLVGTFRHPAQVARSLHARDPAMTIETGLSLWLEYNERLLALHAGRPFPMLCFDTGAEAYLRALGRISAALGLAQPTRADDDDDFFEEGLRTAESAPGIEVPARHREVHAALSAAAAPWQS